MIVIPSLLSMAPMHFIQNYSIHVWRVSVSTVMRHEEDRFGFVPRFPERPQTVSTIWTGPMHGGSYVAELVENHP